MSRAPAKNHEPTLSFCVADDTTVLRTTAHYGGLGISSRQLSRRHLEWCTLGPDGLSRALLEAAARAITPAGRRQGYDRVCGRDVRALHLFYSHQAAGRVCRGLYLQHRERQARNMERWGKPRGVLCFVYICMRSELPANAAARAKARNTQQSDLGCACLLYCLFPADVRWPIPAVLWEGIAAAGLGFCALSGAS